MAVISIGACNMCAWGQLGPLQLQVLRREPGRPVYDGITGEK